MQRQRPVRGRCRLETSRRVEPWQYSLANSVGGILKSGLHVRRFKIRIVLKNLLSGHALGHHANDGRNENPQFANTRDTVHLLGLDSDAVHSQQEHCSKRAESQPFSVYRQTPAYVSGEKVAVDGPEAA
jgi:hypothetical protein